MTDAFEQERQRILAEIEARARASQPMNLKEWMKAVEEILPDEKPAAPGEESGRTPLSATSTRRVRKAARRARRAEKRTGSDPLADDIVQLSSSTRAESGATASRQAATAGTATSSSATTAAGAPSMAQVQQTGSSRGLIIFSMIIGFTLMAALGGIGFLGYLKITEQLAVLQKNDARTSQRIDQLQEKLEALEQRQQQAGTTLVLQTSQQGGEGGPDQHGEQRRGDNPPVATLNLALLGEQMRQQLQDSGIVTEMLLNTQLKRLQTQLTQTVDKRFATLMTQLKALQSQLAQQKTARADTATTSDVTISTLPEETLRVRPPTAPAPPVVDRPTPSSARAETPSARASTSPKQQTVVAQQEGTTRERKTPARRTPLTAAERWLARLPGSHFTLQLASVRDRASLEEMKQLYGLNEARIVRHVKNGRTYYLLITGHYDSKEAAFRAAEAMKAQLGSMPWIRRIRALQWQLPR